MTPATPLNSEMLARERNIMDNFQRSPHLPRTPKPNLKSFKKLFKLGKKKLKRNKSTEHVLGKAPVKVSC